MGRERRRTQWKCVDELFPKPQFLLGFRSPPFSKKIGSEHGPRGRVSYTSTCSTVHHPQQPPSPSRHFVLSVQVRIEETPPDPRATPRPIQNALTISCPRYAPRPKLGKAHEVFLAFPVRAKRKGKKLVSTLFTRSRARPGKLLVEECLASLSGRSIVCLPRVARESCRWARRCARGLACVPFFGVVFFSC